MCIERERVNWDNDKNKKKDMIKIARENKREWLFKREREGGGEKEKWRKK